MLAAVFSEAALRGIAQVTGRPLDELVVANQTDGLGLVDLIGLPQAPEVTVPEGTDPDAAIAMTAADFAQLMSAVAHLAATVGALTSRVVVHEAVIRRVLDTGDEDGGS